MSFLPSDYEVPQSGRWMKFQPGKNKFRILGSAVVGNEFWRSNGEGREPVRRRMHEKIGANELEVNPKTGDPEKVKHFWAFPVWNYGANCVQVLELTQKSVMGAIQTLVEEPDWGDPTRYDLIVTKKGSGLDTEYSVQPSPAKVLDEAIAVECEQHPVNMDALFSNGDPFVGGGGGKSNSNGSTSTPTNNAGAVAMGKAKQAYRAKYSTQPVDEVKAGWEQQVKKYFLGKNPAMVTAAEWEKFVGDGFEKAAPADPFSASEEFQEADIPFDFAPAR